MQCFNQGWHSDVLIEIIYKRQDHRSAFFSYAFHVAEFIERAYEIGFNNAIDIISITNTWEAAGDHSKPFALKFKSRLFEILLSNCSNTTWVDIESEFYDQLKGTLNSGVSSQDKQKRLSQLNESLKYIISELELYLNSLETPQFIGDYISIILSKIKNEHVYGISIAGDIRPETTLILNFNYTPTIQPYLDWFDKNPGHTKPELNHIHGELGSEFNPLIFGFGDELDEAYLQMERESAKGYFEFIKSFWYFRTENYRKLISLIDSAPYQICVLGHSCGLSDRTMLHMLFEHDNCKSIVIYYYGGSKHNNYTSITHEIARHFKDKEKMRNRIVSLPLSSAMPQAEG